MLFHLACAVCLVLPLLGAPLPTAASQERQEIKIGVLAKRGSEQDMAKWQPTAAYLGQALPAYTFAIVPLNFHDVRQAVAAGTIDFIITNSAYYVHLEFDHGISRIATLKNLVNHIPQKHFGGVIFTRADRVDISSFADLVGKTFSAVDPDSFGGWQMAWRELQAQGIRPDRDFSSLVFTGTHDKVVHAVLAGQTDAGTVRTDALERMAAEGKIALPDLKIIAAPELDSAFPYLCSTRLYPEWPFAKLKHTSDDLAERVSIALISMPPDAEAARAASLAGWTVPLDYQPVHELLQELHLGPYQRHLGPITVTDFYREHKGGVVLIALLFILLFLCLSILFRLNRRLQQTKNDLAEQLAKVKGAEQNYQEIFNGTNEAIIVHDRRDGAILDVNQAMGALYGYSPEEAKKLSNGDLSAGEAPYTREEAIRLITRITTGENKTFQWRARKKDGTLFWVEINLKEALIGGHRRVLAVIHDITERKGVEQELQRYRDHLEEMIRERSADLQKSETNLAEAQRLSHLGSWEWHIADNSLWWSEETYRIFGLHPTDAPTSLDTFLAAIHPDDRPMVEEAIAAALRGIDYDIEHRIIRPDGAIRLVQERGKIFLSKEQTPLRMMGSVQDITERKKIEQEQRELRNQLNQAQKLEAIGTMASGIAHDFNNILGAINGYTELALMRLGENREVTPLLDQVMRAGRRAKDLVDQILTFSRKEKLHRQPIAVAAIIEESLKLLRATIPTNIDLQARILAKTSRVMADPTQIHQIVLNLCTNAHHAMEQKQEGVLTVELVDEEIDNHHPQAGNLPPGPYVKLAISDTGTGIQPEHLGRIFDPFFTTKEHGKGTGMGLSVVHGIVNSCDGAIVARSIVGQGTTFTIYLPKISQEAPQTEQTVASQPFQPGQGKILFVDDEPCLVELGQLILEHLGYQVTGVSSSTEALELIRQQPGQFDLLITDQSMPKMTGCQLAHEVTAIRPDLPIILCSGYGSLMSQEDIKTMGIRHFIRKPYDTAILSSMVNETLIASPPRSPDSP
jgi:phosphate/phosphite/phosphonate ABC transporter binding protein